MHQTHFGITLAESLLEPGRRSDEKVPDQREHKQAFTYLFACFRQRFLCCHVQVHFTPSPFVFESSFHLNHLVLLLTMKLLIGQSRAKTGDVVYLFHVLGQGVVFKEGLRLVGIEVLCLSEEFRFKVFLKNNVKSDTSKTGDSSQHLPHTPSASHSDWLDPREPDPESLPPRFRAQLQIKFIRLR